MVIFHVFQTNYQQNASFIALVLEANGPSFRVLCLLASFFDTKSINCVESYTLTHTYRHAHTYTKSHRHAHLHTHTHNHTYKDTQTHTHTLAEKLIKFQFDFPSHPFRPFSELANPRIESNPMNMICVSWQNDRFIRQHDDDDLIKVITVSGDAHPKVFELLRLWFDCSLNSRCAIFNIDSHERWCLPLRFARTPVCWDIKGQFKCLMEY